MTNFDIVGAVKDVNEEFTAMKVVRNNREYFFKIYLPIVVVMDLMSFPKSFFKAMIFSLLVHDILQLGTSAIMCHIIGDIYKGRSEERLDLLVPKFSDINVNTTTELLKEAKCYKRIYNFKMNEQKLPQILESKYILVPSYDYKGDIVDTSILQEHVVGSKEYVLSVGSPQKVLKLASSKI